MKKLCLFAVMLLVLISARPRLSKYSVQFWGSFDTVTLLVAYCESDEEFNTLANRAIDSFSKLHRFYDRFSEYDRIVNLATLNNNPAQRISLSDELFALLEFGTLAPKYTENAVNQLFGSVTELWRKKITSAGLSGEETPPDDAALFLANRVFKESSLILGRNQTALLSQGAMVDVGAFAKGFAIDLVSQELLQLTPHPFALISGGNIYAFGAPPGQKGWPVSVSDPDKALLTDSPPVARANIMNGSAATSGDYQRYFVHNSQKMHHIISPFTLYPANHYRSVTVLAKTAAQADLFSTAIFIFDFASGKRLAEEHALSVCWVNDDKSVVIYNGPNQDIQFLQ